MLGLKQAAAAVGALALVGCGSTLNAIFERSVSSEPLDRTQVVTMTGERRVTIAVDRNGPYTVCAESLPDAARALGARTVGDLDLGTANGQARASGGFDDQVQTALLQTNTRTEIADVSRILGFQVCSAYANNGINQTQYGSLLRDIITGANSAMLANAQRPPPSIGTARTVQVSLAEPAVRPHRRVAPLPPAAQKP